MNTYTKKSRGAAALRKKLFSAAAMLLVASIMLVSTSYAWLVLSTAPEVTGISTQVGANGALEIALLDTQSYSDLTRITNADIDESVTVPSVSDSNLSWGNLVGLGDASYGLSQIVLNPSRLFISPGSTDGEGNQRYTINPNVLLKTPIYGEDGRIIGLDKSSAVSNTYNAKKVGFPANNLEGYGVRAIGTSASMSAFQLGINAARAAISVNRDAAKNTASMILNKQGSALADVAIAVALGDGTEQFSKTDVGNMKILAEGLQGSLNYIELALRQVFVGYLSSDGAAAIIDGVSTPVTTDNLANLKAEIENMGEGKLSFDALKAKYPAVTGIDEYITKLQADQVKLDNAIDECDRLIDDPTQESFGKNTILGIMSPLVNYNDMELGGHKVSALRGLPIEQLAEIVMNSGMEIIVPTGSGLISDIADFTTDYTAKVTVAEISYGSISLKNQTAAMTTRTTCNPTYLAACDDIIRSFVVSSGAGSESFITDYYGYVLDLAFRTNAADSNLQLQTASTQRIYSDSDNAATQGGGSYMEFRSNADLSATKMLKLMAGIRVVFIDETNNVVALAALDTTVGQEDYTTSVGTTTTYTVKESLEMTVDGTETTVYFASTNCTNYRATLTEAEYTVLEATTKVDTSAEETKYILGKDAYTAATSSAMPDGKYAVLDVPVKQNSDYITESEFNGLPAESVVDIAADGTIKAPLYLYEFTMPMSGVNTEEVTGALELGVKKTSPAITALEENAPKKVSVLVYLDGSVVDNSMVAANSSQSMTGTMNLQFSSSANLMPMNNQTLFDGEDAATPPESGSGGNGGENGSESGSGSDPVGSGGDDPANGTT